MSSQPKLPIDTDRSFKIRSNNIMKKSVKLTSIGARIAIYMERGDTRIVFKTHPDLLPDWNTCGADQVNPDAFPDELNFNEFRFSSSPRPAEAASNQVVVASSPSASPAGSLAPSRLPDISPPPEAFSITGSKDFQAPVADYEDPLLQILATNNQSKGTSSPSAKKRKRPASVPVASVPTQQRKRAKTASWFV